MIPTWAPLAHRIHVAGMILGTALLTFLIYRLLRSGLWRRYPFFLAYLLIAAARAVQGFVGISELIYLWSEAAAMAAKALAILEGAILLFPRPRVPTLAVLASLGAILAGIALLLPAEPNPVREFERWRTAAHVGLATFTAAGCGWLWRRQQVVNPHTLFYWRIWTFRLGCMAALGFVNYQAWPDLVISSLFPVPLEMRWVGYYLWAAGFLVSGYVASLLWIRWASRFGCGLASRTPLSRL